MSHGIPKEAGIVVAHRPAGVPGREDLPPGPFGFPPFLPGVLHLRLPVVAVTPPCHAPDDIFDTPDTLAAPFDTDTVEAQGFPPCYSSIGVLLPMIP